ncbi:MAG: sigma-54-dependent transcriptional regulator [Povalibacter sp.]
MNAPDTDTVLVVDDTPTNVKVLVEVLSREGYRVLVAREAESALEQARYAMPLVILLDVMMPGMDGFEACRRLKATPATADIPVIFMTALGDLEDKVKGFDAGGADYVVKPFEHEEVLARVRTQVHLRKLQLDLARSNELLEQRVAERTAELKTALTQIEALKTRLEHENRYLQQEISEQGNHRDIVGSSQALRHALHQLEMVAATDTTVLVHGETGTGKELIARAIHERSSRRDRPLVKLNCSAISAGLVESELFGHVKGAFTGATDRRVGRFELADGGTLFLDEVSELPLDTQTKLLRVLQEGEFEAVGSSRTQQVNVRVIAASNRDLQLDVASGRFRADLFYRLNVFPIHVPPLRARTGDIPVLAQFFMERFARKLGKPLKHISPTTLAALQAHSWPGNIRDLQNTIERAAVLSTGDTLEVEWSLQAPAQSCFAAVASNNGNGSAATSSEPRTLEEMERQHFISVLRQTRGIIEGPNGAARILDLKPSTARFRIRKLGIKRDSYQ